MAAGKGERQACAFAGADKLEFGAGGAMVLNLFCAKLRLGARSERQDTTVRDVRETRDARIVRILDREGLRAGEPFDQFALGEGDFVDRSEKFQMNRRHARDHAHLGLGNLSEAPQLAAM